MKFELYKKMLRGEGSPEENQLVKQWLEEDPAFFEQAMLQEARQMEQQEMPEPVKKDMLDFFAQQGIPQPGVREAAKAPVITMRAGWLRWVGVAAVIVAMLTSWLFYRTGKTTEPAIVWKNVMNPGTEAMLVTLPDSTKVWLNTLAVLRYRADFNNHEQRAVQLSGEAYFKVTHDATHPFTVQTEALITKVLGTEFNVEAYPGEQQIKVCLQKGKVQVDCTDTVRYHLAGGKVLLPGQMATYYKQNAVINVKPTTVALPAAWIENGLVLNDVPLPDALRRIAKKYNRQIVFNPDLATRYKHVTATYRNMDVLQVLSQLGFTCNFSVRKIQDTYRIDVR